MKISFSDVFPPKKIDKEKQNLSGGLRSKSLLHAKCQLGHKISWLHGNIKRANQIFFLDLFSKSNWNLTGKCRTGKKFGFYSKIIYRSNIISCWLDRQSFNISQKMKWKVYFAPSAADHFFLAGSLSAAMAWGRLKLAFSVLFLSFLSRRPRPAVTWNQYWGFKNIFPMTADRVVASSRDTDCNPARVWNNFWIFAFFSFFCVRILKSAVSAQIDMTRSVFEVVMTCFLWEASATERKVCIGGGSHQKTTGWLWLHRLQQDTWSQRNLSKSCDQYEIVATSIQYSSVHWIKVRENYLYADADADAIILKRNSCHGNGGQHEDYRECQMSVARVPLPTIVVVDSEKSAEDQLRTMVTLYRCSDPHEVCFRSDNNYNMLSLYHRALINLGSWDIFVPYCYPRKGHQRWKSGSLGQKRKL